MDQAKQLKHYEILSRIGEGGMGVVYRARDTRLGRTVALKVLHEDLAGDEERNRRFEREARIVSSLSHPGIATIYDFDREGSTAFFAMELVEGSTLRQLLASGPLSAERVIDCGVQITEALAAAHHEGVIHRDLKPENVIAASSGYYKVLDFGVARIESPANAGAGRTQLETRSWATSAGGILGTVAYMSPEQALADPIDKRSDIFSMGSLLYELATGRPAFSGNNAIATANAIVHQPPPPMGSLRPELPEGLLLVVDKCLAKRPEDRYQTADALVQDLRTLQLSNLTGSRSYRQLLAHRENPARRRRSALALGLAAMLLLAAGVTAAWLVLPGGAEPTRVVPGPRAPAALQPPAMAAAMVAEKPRVIVAFFENPTQDPTADWLRRGLPEMLSTDLSLSGEFDVIATQRLYDLASMAGEAGGDELDQSTVAELARWAGASLVISGSVFKLGDVYRIDAQAYDTDTGTITVARKVEGDDLFVMVTELTAGLRQDLQLDSRAPDELLRVATSSEDAFRMYTAAGESYDNLEFERAADQLAQSLRVDPEFALARLRLAMSQYELGDIDAATASVRQVMLEAERLPEADRMFAQALDAFLIGQDLKTGSTHLERLLEEHPRHRWANVLWARGLDELADDPVGATRKLQRAIEQDPNNLLAIASLADHLARFGAASDAQLILRDAAARNPDASVQLERVIEKLERRSEFIAP